MAETVSDFMVQRLYEWGIHRIYGYPGDGINGIMGALARAQDKIEFIQVRHEEMAAFMAPSRHRRREAQQPRRLHLPHAAHQHRSVSRSYSRCHGLLGTRPSWEMGDSKETLRALIPQLRRKQDRGFASTSSTTSPNGRRPSRSGR